MRQHDFLVVLDFDNTLLHTWHYQSNVNPEVITEGYIDKDAALYEKKLLEQYEGSLLWNDGVVLPRPHFKTFAQYLMKLNADIGIYSTAEDEYIRDVLQHLYPDLLHHCMFNQRQKVLPS